MTDSSGRYASFERLYQHHTVASLAHRVDFNPSMLEGRKTFRAPARSHSISTSRPSAAVTLTSPTRSKRNSLSKGPSSAPPKLINNSNNKKSNNSKAHTPSPAKKPASPAKKQVKSTATPGSLSRLIASTRPAKTEANGGPVSVNSSSSTQVTENTNKKTRPLSDKKQVAAKYANLTVDVADTNVKTSEDLLRPPMKDADDDMLDDLLDEPGSDPAASANDGEQDDNDIDPCAELAAQEAAMAQALERAVEEFETVAASSRSNNNYRTSGEANGGEENTDINNKTVDNAAVPDGDSGASRPLMQDVHMMEQSSLRSNFTTSSTTNDIDAAIRASEEMARALQANATT
ncbi:hypothetical protein ACA910_021753 [Epithemia clementina (nom. ined.)]